MKATELRIGNWVYFKNSETGLFTNSLPVESGVEIDYVDSGNLDIKPIPLTEEWLVRFGFERFLNSYHLKSNKLFAVREVGGMFVYEFECYMIDIPDVKLPFVHRLQNLYFALTGEELTLQPPL